ncbi:MAG: hypothetical protein A2Y41_05930 [Spirochaetes bacterium GWB1_36_13]|nr:MAG: hypothetical protein A2Y41_05930 [Spirochaetes bacterium GWB1_36_13]
MRNEIIKIVFETIQELNEDLENENLKNPTEETKLYGINGNLKSIDLVTLVSDIETKISEKFNKEIILADEKAMSQERSPFLSVKSLADYIEKLLNEG